MDSQTYPSSMSLGDALRLFFEENDFGADGGYGAKWVKLKVGPLTLAFPNSAARVRAVRFHDLHHIVTGYTTDLVGEAEIGAWEIASGCGRHLAAWILNLLAMWVGLFVRPRAIVSAFYRGRRSRNLYRSEYDDALLGASVAEMRARLGLNGNPTSPAARDHLALAGWAGVSFAWSASVLALSLAPLALLIWLVSALR